MADKATISQVRSHLSLLGYDVSVEDDEIRTIGARHAEEMNMRVRVFDAGIFFSAIRSIIDLEPSPAFTYIGRV